MTEAPRWRLQTAHYLNVPELPDGTRVEWEHKETARDSGRTVRKLFAVPMLLDPKDAADHNYPGEIIVTNFVEGARIPVRDYIFTGEPTPDMEPLNDEAQEISDGLREKWINPVETLPANGGMNEAESAFMQKMMQAFAGAAQAPNASVPKEQYDALLARVTALEEARGKPTAQAVERRT